MWDIKKCTPWNTISTRNNTFTILFFYVAVFLGFFSEVTHLKINTIVLRGQCVNDISGRESTCHCGSVHDDVTIFRVTGHRSPVNSPHKGQWRGALMFSLICARINGWVNNREAGDLRRHRAHHDVTVMWKIQTESRHYVCIPISIYWFYG